MHLYSDVWCTIDPHAGKILDIASVASLFYFVKRVNVTFTRRIKFFFVRR